MKKFTLVLLLVFLASATIFATPAEKKAAENLWVLGTVCENADYDATEVGLVTIKTIVFAATRITIREEYQISSYEKHTTILVTDRLGMASDEDLKSLFIAAFSHEKGTYPARQFLQVLASQERYTDIWRISEVVTCRLSLVKPVRLARHKVKLDDILRKKEIDWDALHSRAKVIASIEQALSLLDEKNPEAVVPMKRMHYMTIAQKEAAKRKKSFAHPGGLRLYSDLSKACVWLARKIKSGDPNTYFDAQIVFVDFLMALEREEKKISDGLIDASWQLPYSHEHVVEPGGVHVFTVDLVDRRSVILGSEIKAKDLVGRIKFVSELGDGKYIVSR